MVKDECFGSEGLSLNINFFIQWSSDLGPLFNHSGYQFLYNN